MRCGKSVNECRVLHKLTDLLNRGIFYRCFDKAPFLYGWVVSIGRSRDISDPMLRLW